MVSPLGDDSSRYESNGRCGGFDPRNAKGSTVPTPYVNGNKHGKRDNWGTMNILGGGVAKFEFNESFKKKGFEITSAYAGDNYIVAAHPNPGVVDQYRFQDDGVTLERKNGNVWTALDTDLQTKMLTVWRTLNVECDVMPYYQGPGSSGPVITPACPSEYLGGIITTELARACVEIKIYAPNDNQPEIGTNPMDATQMVVILDEQVIPGRHSGRDLPKENNSHQFWMIRIVTVSRYDGHSFAAFLYGHNTILLSMENIQTGVSLWNDFDPQSLQIDVVTLTKRALLHEIAHLLIDGREPFIRIDSMGNAFLEQDPNLIPVNLAEQGVRANFIDNSRAPDLYTPVQPPHRIFEDRDIREIQEYSRARD